MDSSSCILRLTGLEKSYPGVRALEGANFDLVAGEIHCLIGENGAGKSTLIRILSGAERPDAGRIEIAGAAYQSINPSLGHELGIAVVYQELDLILPLTVAENIYLGHEPVRAGAILDRSLIRRATQALNERFHLGFPLDARARDLGPAQRQLVQIAKALSRDIKILVLDEPTASLTDNETEHLFDVLERLKRQGIGIIYVSHRLREIMTIADRVTVMRDGGMIATRARGDFDEDRLIEWMVGRPLGDRVRRPQAASTEIVLSTRGLSVAGQFEDLNIDLHKGEVLGLGGLVGAGRSELIECLFGLTTPSRGEITLNGTPVRLTSPREAVRHGLGLMPEERRESGLVLGRSVLENIVFPIPGKVCRLGFLRRGAARRISDALVADLRIKTPSVNQLTRNLSGGNQQKIVLAKWLAAGSRILLLDEPTRGIDVNSKFEIYQLIDDLVGKGVSVIMASSDLTELLSLSDRILVLAEGRLTKELLAAGSTQVDVMRYAVPRAAAEARL